jgi:plasmid maintenance system antidote protein VapI
MKLKKYIQANQMSISFLAKELGIHYTYALRLVKGSRHPSPRMAAKIIALTKGKVSWDDIYSQS